MLKKSNSPKLSFVPEGEVRSIVLRRSKALRGNKIVLGQTRKRIFVAATFL